MRLVFDLRHIPERGSGAGVSHASLELADALESLVGEYGIETIRLTNPKRSWPFRRAVLESKADAVLVLSGSVPPFLPVPAFPWVHDVAIFKHPEWFPQSPIRRWITTSLFLRGVRRASHVFAVSEDTKRELMQISGIPTERITVTHQGIRPISPGERQGYALILGSINSRKNIPFIHELWPDVMKQVPDTKLIVAGKPFSDFDDSQRDEYVRHASALLLPSLHEGFGRTALEALSAGVPVIASNRGAIPEVVGDAGVLLDPTDREAWITNIVRGLRGELDGSRGPAQAARFSWDSTARIILAKLAEFG